MTHIFYNELHKFKILLFFMDLIPFLTAISFNLFHIKKQDCKLFATPTNTTHFFYQFHIFRHFPLQ